MFAMSAGKKDRSEQHLGEINKRMREEDQAWLFEEVEKDRSGDNLRNQGGIC